MKFRLVVLSIKLEQGILYLLGKNLNNKRPKGPNIMQLRTMCHLFDRSARAAIIFTHRPAKHKLGRGHWDIAFCQVSLNSVLQFYRKSKKCLSQTQAGAPSCFSDPPKNTTLVEEVEILLPVKFCKNSVQRFQRRSWKCLGQSEARAAIFFSPNQNKKHKLGRERWDLAYCQVLLNSVQWFQMRSWKCFSQSEARAGILFFRSARKNKLGRGHWDLASCQISLNSVQQFQWRSWKRFSQSEARAAILFFRSARKTQTW